MESGPNDSRALRPRRSFFFGVKGRTLDCGGGSAFSFAASGSDSTGAASRSTGFAVLCGAAGIGDGAGVASIRAD